MKPLQKNTGRNLYETNYPDGGDQPVLRNCLHAEAVPYGGAPERYTKEERWKHLQFWVERACKGGRIVLEALAQEKRRGTVYSYPNIPGNV